MGSETSPGWLARPRRMLAILFLAVAIPVGAVDTARRVYVVGVVPQYSQRTLVDIWRPIVEELEARTGLQFRLEGSPGIPEFEQKLVRGQFDCAYMNPYHFLVAYRRQGYRPLIRDRSRSLQGILVVSADSPVALPDLAGRRIVFPAPNALGASLLMRAELRRVHGLSFEARFVETHTSVYLNVVKGAADAGGGVSRTLALQPPEVRNALRVLYRTRPVSPHPFACHPRLPVAHRKVIRKAFLAMGEKRDTARLLARIPIFDIGVAEWHDYEPLTNLGLDELYEGS